MVHVRTFFPQKKKVLIGKNAWLAEDGETKMSNSFLSLLNHCAHLSHIRYCFCSLMLYYIARFMASTHAGQKIIQNLASVSIMVFKIKARKRANLLFY